MIPGPPPFYALDFFQLLKFNFTVSVSSLFVLALNGPIGISGQLLSA